MQRQKVETQTGSMLGVLQQRVHTQAQMKAWQWPASRPGTESSEVPVQVVSPACSAPSSRSQKCLR